MSKIQRLLVASQGEIAIRVFRSMYASSLAAKWKQAICW
jgi:pyruvate carboxylase